VESLDRQVVGIKEVKDKFGRKSRLVAGIARRYEVLKFNFNTS
jgi:hypothetical protein